MNRLLDMSRPAFIAGLTLTLLAPANGALGKSFKLLHAFEGGSDGAFPEGGLIADKAGNLYGLTNTGGTSDAGTVYKVSPAGRETVLYSFQDPDVGSGPRGPLLADKNGNLLGVTTGGGGYGYGTVFSLAPDGRETRLHAFTGGTDGGIPAGGLVADGAGNLYGTAFTGGIGSCEGHTCGVVFKLASDGTESVLYAFTGGADGSGPYAGLMADASGNLYGTTRYGGNTGCSGLGCGVVFKLTPAGSESVIYTFSGGADGAAPAGALIADKKGNLLGATDLGGVDGNGVIFRLTPSGSETVLYDFTSFEDGRSPAGPLVTSRQGDIVGTASIGGYNASEDCQRSGCGTVFKIRN